MNLEFSTNDKDDFLVPPTIKIEDYHSTDFCDENMKSLSDNGEEWEVYCCKPGKNRIKYLVLKLQTLLCRLSIAMALAINNQNNTLFKFREKYHLFIPRLAHCSLEVC